MGSLRQSKETQALLFVKQKGDLLEPGVALPGIYQLMKESGLGRRVLENTVRRLCDEGYLEVRPRRGTFRTSKDNFTASREIVDVLFCVSGTGSFRPVTFMGEMIQALNDLAAQRGLSVRIHQLVYDHAYEEAIALARKYRIQQCFLVSPLNSSIPSALKSVIPCLVEIIPRYMSVGGPAVVDNPDMAVMQMNYLYMLGHRAIAYIHDISEYQDSAFVQYRRLIDYYRFMSEHDLRVNPNWVFRADNQRVPFFRQLNRMLKAEPPPTAAVVADSALQRLYEYCRIHRIAIGSELSIMGSDGLKSLSLTPSVTTIINLPFAIVEQAWKIMDDLRDGVPNKSIIANKLTLKTGNSAKRISVPEPGS